MSESTSTDLVLAPMQYALIQDTTKGQVSVITGPNKMSPSQSDQPVYFDAEKGDFVPCSLRESIKQFVKVPEGSYVVLSSPAADHSKAHPPNGTSNNSVELNFGRRVHIEGPASFALWPSQVAQVVEGHTLRSNQYLVATVYNDEAANANRDQGVMKPSAVTNLTGVLIAARVAVIAPILVQAEVRMARVLMVVVIRPPLTVGHLVIHQQRRLTSSMVNKS